MRSLIINGAAFLLAASAVVSGQTVAAPGRIGTAPGSSFPLFDTGTAKVSSPVLEKTSIAEVNERHDRLMNRLWIGSMFLGVAATGADAATSWGKREGNALLASPDGNFGARGLSIKAALAAAVIVPQICLRRHRDLKGAFAIGNFAGAALFTGASVHNAGLRAANH